MPVRKERRGAAAAAARVALRIGLGVTRPRVLAAGSSLVIDLAPFPVVARVSRGDSDPERVPQALQVELANHAVRHGGPVVAPLPDGFAGPHIEGDFVVTFWNRASDRPVSPAAAGHSLLLLHRSIANFGGSLPSFDPRPGVRRIAAGLPVAAHGKAVVLQAACDVFQWPELPVQPLHGDAHLGNALSGPAGPLWIDFEYACVGPIEWDLASVAHQATVIGRKVAETRAMLAGYGPDAADRAVTLVDAVGLRVAAQTLAALTSRPDLEDLAQRRFDWVRQRLRRSGFS